MLESRYGAPMARALYCSVDATVYRPADVPMRWHLGYLGTYSEDRQPALERLLLEPARRAPSLRFVVAGPQYPETIAWPENVERIAHLGPGEHVEFYSSLGATLNVTRRHGARRLEPGVRLFEAAACAVPIVSDAWPGLSALFAPGREIIVADPLPFSMCSAGARSAVAQSALPRRRILAEHTRDIARPSRALFRGRGTQTLPDRIAGVIPQPSGPPADGRSGAAGTNGASAAFEIGQSGCSRT